MMNLSHTPSQASPYRDPRIAASASTLDPHAASIPALQAELSALRDQLRRSSAQIDAATGHAIITLDLDGRVTGWNAGACRILRYAGPEITGRVAEIFFTAEDRARGAFYAELQAALQNGQSRNERWHLRRDGTRFWASGLTTPVLGEAGQPTGFLTIFQDNTELRAEDERRDLLMVELNHRIKTAFALAQAVADQTGRHAASMADFTAALAGRLAVLARSHDVLFEGAWADTPLLALAAAVRGYVEDPARITFGGPPALLPSRLVVPVSLAIHELATNAVKHGSLGVPGGSVAVQWDVNAAASRVRLLWQESGGPPVRPPSRRGLGIRLLTQSIPPEGTLRLDFLPDGLECRVELSLADG